MRLFEHLDEDNFLLYAAKNYDNPLCENMEEFHEDLNRIKYIKRLFRRYVFNGDLQERLILNHIIVFYNVFGIRAANRMMFYRIEPEHWSILKPFLIYLNYLKPDEYVDVPLDPTVVNRLRSLT